MDGTLIIPINPTLLLTIALAGLSAAWYFGRSLMTAGLWLVLAASYAVRQDGLHAVRKFRDASAKISVAVGPDWKPSCCMTQFYALSAACIFLYEALAATFIVLRQSSPQLLPGEQQRRARHPFRMAALFTRVNQLGSIQ